MRLRTDMLWITAYYGFTGDDTDQRMPYRNAAPRGIVIVVGSRSRPS